MTQTNCLDILTFRYNSEQSELVPATVYTSMNHYHKITLIEHCNFTWDILYGNDGNDIYYVDDQWDMYTILGILTNKFPTWVNV